MCVNQCVEKYRHLNVRGGVIVKTTFGCFALFQVIQVHQPKLATNFLEMHKMYLPMMLNRFEITNLKLLDVIQFHHCKTIQTVSKQSKGHFLSQL